MDKNKLIALLEELKKNADKAIKEIRKEKVDNVKICDYAIENMDELTEKIAVSILGPHRMVN